MYDDTAARTIAVVARCQGVAEEDVTIDSTFEELGIDSLQGINVVFELEYEFDVTVPNEDALQLRTIREAVDRIHRLVTESRAEESA